MLQTEERIATLLDAAIQEMELLAQMMADVTRPDDVASSLCGMTLYRSYR